MIHFIHGFLGQKQDLNLSPLQAKQSFQSHDLYELILSEESQQTFLSQLHEQSILIGYSMGGRWLLKFCEQHNIVPKKLILISAHYGLANQSQRNQRLKFEDQVIEKLRHETLENFLQFWNHLEVFSHDEIRDCLPPVSREVLIEAFDHMRLSRLPNYSSWIKSNHQKIVFLYGSFDEKYAQVAQTLSQWGVKTKSLEGGHRLIYHPLLRETLEKELCHL